MFERTYRAEGIPAGCRPVDRWPLHPHQPPMRLRPMFVVPPPRRSRLRRILTAFCRLGGTIAASAGMMILAQYLTTPG